MNSISKGRIKHMDERDLNNIYCHIVVISLSGHKRKKPESDDDLELIDRTPQACALNWTK